MTVSNDFFTQCLCKANFPHGSAIRFRSSKRGEICDDYIAGFYKIYVAVFNLFCQLFFGVSLNDIIEGK